MPDFAENTFFLSPTSVQEIKCEIKILNTKKASGPDNIGAEVLKLCPHIFASNLSKIYNRSIKMGEYPSQLKCSAKVIALYKKGVKLQPNNYRHFLFSQNIWKNIVLKTGKTFRNKYNFIQIPVRISQAVFYDSSIGRIYWHYYSICGRRKVPPPRISICRLN